MSEKIVLITGATSGLGIETAKVMAKEGYRVIIHGRNIAKANKVTNDILQQVKGAKLDTIICDLESKADIRRMVKEYKCRYDHLDVLINNAGNQYGGVWEGTKEGHEKNFMVNTLAPFLLTLLLLDYLEKSDDGRVITVSSASHAMGGEPLLNDIELKKHFSYIKAYGFSKLYVIWIMRHFVKYCKQKGIKNVTFNVVHPGSVKTNLGNTGNRPLSMKVIFFLWQPLMTTVEKGVKPTIFAATADEMKGVNNKYIGPKGYEKVNEKYYTEEKEQIIWNYCMKACVD